MRDAGSLRTLSAFNSDNGGDPKLQKLCERYKWGPPGIIRIRSAPAVIDTLKEGVLCFLFPAFKVLSSIGKKVGIKQACR